MKYRIAFIGTGKRSVVYAKAYAACEEIEVAALADPAADHRRLLIERSGLEKAPAQYDDWRTMLARHTDLDGAVIGSPNFLHADQAVECLRRGMAVAMEKPLATTQADCERILQAQRGGGGRTLVGFVLRSTPFYSKIRQWAAAGAIGRIVSVQADELPGPSVTAIMHRSPWRRHQADSGGAMLEKCCHDMDILTWIIGRRPVSVNSFGGTYVFRPDPSRPDRCRDCPPAKRCAYYLPPETAEKRDFRRSDDLCIYNIDKDGADVQSVAIEYEGGAVANFLLNFHCFGPRAGRNFHAVGLDGRIWGNHEQHVVCLYDNRSREVQEFDARGDGSGHGGGDRSHAMTLLKMLKDPSYRPEADAAAGYLSAVLCFAADASRRQRRRVDLRYRPDGSIEIV